MTFRKRLRHEGNHPASFPTGGGVAWGSHLPKTPLRKTRSCLMHGLPYPFELGLVQAKESPGRARGERISQPSCGDFLPRVHQSSSCSLPATSPIPYLRYPTACNNNIIIARVLNPRDRRVPRSSQHHHESRRVTNNPHCLKVGHRERAIDPLTWVPSKRCCYAPVRQTPTP